MKKLVILTTGLSVIFLLILVFGFRSGVTTTYTEPVNHDSGVIEHTVASMDAPPSENKTTDKEPEVLLNTSEPGTGAAQFRDQDYNIDGRHVSFEAVVYDYLRAESIPGLPVVRYCDGNKVATDTVTDENGYFRLDFDECGNFHEAWVEVEYNDEKSESNHIRVHIPVRTVSGSSGPTSRGPVGAPEFSTITLALAVIAVTLGLAFLRKH